MKEEKGITLTTLIIYIIILTFVVAGVSTITASFYSNLNEFDKTSESAVAYSKFNMYFLTDIKKENSKIEGYGSNYIILSYTNASEGGTTKVEYKVQDNMLYRNKVKICENVNSVVITPNTANNTIKIDMTIGNYDKTTTYKVGE